MSINNDLAEQSIERTIQLLRYGANTGNEAARAVYQLEKELLKSVLDFEDLKSIGRINKQLKELRALIKERYAEIEKLISGELEELAKLEADWQAASINSMVGVDIITNVPTAAQAAAIAGDSMITGATVSEYWARQSVDTQNRFADAIRLGMSNSETSSQIAKRVSEALGISRREAFVLGKTSVQAVAMQARKNVYIANDDVVKGRISIATLDSHTSFLCFPAQTLVNPVGGLKAVFRRQYTGKLVTITTSSGNKITGTPNHPVLTSGGWLPLNEIEPHKHVVYSVSPDAFAILSNEKVGVPADISKIFDSFNRPTIFNVQRKSPSTADFHSDIDIRDGDIDIVTTKGFLPYTLIPVGRNRIKNKFFGFVKNACILSRNCLVYFHFICLLKSIKSSKLYTRLFESGKNHAFRPICNLFNFRWPVTIPIKAYNSTPVSLDPCVSFTPFKGWHASVLLKKISDSACAGEIPLGNSNCWLSCAITADNVIGKTVELASSTHVYNLNTCREWYIANGIIVHNCAQYDKATYDLDNKPIMGNKLQFIDIPRHFGCRSVWSPILKSFSELGLPFDDFKPSTRASMDGQVDAGMTFNDFLAKKPKAWQDEYLGKGRAELYRDGKITLSDLVSGTGRELTLEQLRKLK